MTTEETEAEAWAGAVGEQPLNRSGCLASIIHMPCLFWVILLVVLASLPLLWRSGTHDGSNADNATGNTGSVVCGSNAPPGND
ncbi:MAG: hypothetical protein H6840_09855 [Planctomycetes bacterium]|nr:hypothetical protein [Planctomycetota bacterium]